MNNQKKWNLEHRRLSRAMWKKQKYPYLKVIKLSTISKMLGYDCPNGQGIMINFMRHERLFERLNDAIKEVVESVGGETYKRNHKYMKGNPKKVN